MPPWELLTGTGAAVIVLMFIVRTLWESYKERQARIEVIRQEHISTLNSMIERLIAERDLALAGWREQTALTNAAVAAFAEERRDRNARRRNGDQS